MLFSVVVPVYNVQNFLTECVDSIISQIKDEIRAEILLIDDGSTDRSPVLCDKYAARYPGLIRVFHNKNQGVFKTRRYGYKMAKGDYIINCDSDDKLEEGMLSQLSSVIQSTDCDVVIFNSFVFYDNDRKVMFHDLFTNEPVCVVEQEALFEKFFLAEAPGVVSICFKAFRKTCLTHREDHSIYENFNQGEDTLQSAEIYTNADKIIYLNQELYHYRIGTGMTTKYDPNYYREWRVVLQELMKYKEIWNLNSFDRWMAVKYFSCVSRAITQSRYQKSMTFSDRKEYLQFIRNDPLYMDYNRLYCYTRDNLKKQYRVLLFLLRTKSYWLIHIFIKLKNI